LCVRLGEAAPLSPGAFQKFHLGGCAIFLLDRSQGHGGKADYALAAAVRAKGGAVDTKAYKGLSRAMLVATLAWPLRLLAPVLRAPSRFIDAHTAS
jgi:hypothetical protein